MEEENREIRIELLVPFKAYSGQTYEGERLQQMMDSIRRSGLITPIIVRPVDSGKYEIICGHNRVKAMEALGYDVIKADIKYELIKFLSKQDKTTRMRIVEAINKLPQGDVKKLQGQENYRLRVGDYRIIFDKNGEILYIEKIDNRGQVYK